MIEKFVVALVMLLFMLPFMVIGFVGGMAFTGLMGGYEFVDRLATWTHRGETK